MTESTHIQEEPAFWLDDQPIQAKEIIDILRSESGFTNLVKSIILNQTLSSIKLGIDTEKALVDDFRKKRGLEEKDKFESFLKDNNLNDSLLRKMVIKPTKIVKYREERWGPRVNSLYLKHKDLYDRITYKRIETNDGDVMQELFFRLKEKEDTWDNIARQLPGAEPNQNATQTLIPANKIEPMLLELLRKSKPNEVTKPICLNENNFVVASLINIETRKLDETLRVEILQKELNDWLEAETQKQIKKVSIAE